MNLHKIFGFQEEKAFATLMVLELAKDIPPELMQKNRRLMSVNKITRLLEKTYAAAGAYQKKNKMGFIRRSVFVNAFQWELKNRNYPDDFTTMATEGLVIELVNKKEASINS
jgi:hypothetical protein